VWLKSVLYRWIREVLAWGVPIIEIRGAATGGENEFRVSKGDLVGIVRPRAGRYEFLVLDMRREEPTMHGVDFPHATAAVTQLLDALAGEQ
jgi:hypothetical protein